MANAGSAEKALRKRYTAEFYSGNRLNFTLSVAAMLLAGLGNLVVSWLMQQIIDAATGAETGLSILQLALISAALVLFLLGAYFIDWRFRPCFTEKALRQYKDRVFCDVAGKSINSFFVENSATYISALSNDIAGMEENYLRKIFVLVQEAVMFAGAFIMMLWYSPLLTLAAVLLSLLPVAASLAVGGRLAKQEKIVSDKNASFVAAVKDLLTGFSVIKSFKAEAEAIRMFARSNEAVEAAKCRRRRTAIIINVIGLLAGFITQLGVFLFGAYLALSGRGVTAGVVIVFVQLMNFVVNPIAEVPEILAARKATMALVDKLAAAIAANPESEGGVSVACLDGAIELRGVSFAYEPGVPVLNGIDARFEAGRSYAVVGGSGSGKTTLLNLLLRSRDDYGGEILFDGNELKTIGTDSLYDLVSLVQQNVFVFNSSVKDNICMFRDFPADEFDRAVSMAGLGELTAARGADFICGENGVALSGGERQRISIARALLHGSSVMLVDEATAALDAETAYAVTNSILDIAGLTRIIVTHRLESSLLEKYDEIIVMRSGEITERGTFDALMAKRGYFYSLYTVAQ